MIELTQREQLLKTTNPVLKSLLRRKIKTLVNVDKGWFFYQFTILHHKIALSFKMDDVSDISFSQKTTVKSIVERCDCISIDNISDPHNTIELVYWAYDGNR